MLVSLYSYPKPPPCYIRFREGMGAADIRPREAADVLEMPWCWQMTMAQVYVWWSLNFIHDHALTIAGRNASGDTYKMGWGGLEVSTKKGKNQEPLGRWGWTCSVLWWHNGELVSWVVSRAWFERALPAEVIL